MTSLLVDFFDNSIQRIGVRGMSWLIFLLCCKCFFKCSFFIEPSSSGEPEDLENSFSLGCSIDENQDLNKADDMSTG